MRVFLFIVLLCATTSVRGQVVDTSTYAILPLMKYPSAFPSNCKSTSLSPKEIDQIEQILLDGIREYNRSMWKKYPEWVKEDSSQFVINLRSYNRQYIAILNVNGEKEIWINCFRKVIYEDGIKPDYSWKEHVVKADDGGNGFFNAKVNLSNKKCYDLFVNGN